MQKPIAPKGEICPFHRKDVSKVCHKCPLYIQVRGTDKNTGKEVDQWGCALAFMPMLTIENSHLQRQTGAAVESFRNEMVKASEATQLALVQQILSSDAPRLIEGNR